MRMTTLKMDTTLFLRMTVCDSNFRRFIYMCLILFLCSAPRNGYIPILRRMREQHETDAEDEEEDEEDSTLDDADDARQYFYFNSVHISMYLILYLNSLQCRGILFE